MSKYVAQTGSTYNTKNNLLAYGAHITNHGKMKHTIKGLVGDDEQLKAHNIGGEYMAVLEVLKWCRENNVVGIKILVAAEVAERLANKVYKPRKEVSHRFVEEMTFYMNTVRPFIKRRNGNKGNKGLDLARRRMKTELQYLGQVRVANALESTQKKTKKRKQNKYGKWVKIN